jgi:PEP-CTERM/exosortase A-associated glycosyltransferase
VRILHVFDHSPPLQSGYVSRSLGIIAGQRARGWETLHLTTPRYHSCMADRETIDGLTFYRSRPVRTRAPVAQEILEMQATKRALERLVKAERPDIIHAHSPVLNGLPAISIGKRHRLPVVYEIRALWEDAAVDLGHAREGSLRYRASRWLETHATSRADRIVVLCNPLREEIIARGIARDRVTVIPNAVEASFLSPCGPRQPALKAKLGIAEQPVIGFIGSFYAYEGLDLLLKAIPGLARRIPSFIVLLVGGGPEDQRLRGIAREMGIERYVRFAGRVHHEEVAQHYDLVDICVFPRRRIRLTDLVTPLKPLEAMGRGKPVIASDVGGHRELIVDGKTGFLFPADDLLALENALAAVLSNASEAQRIAAAGHKHVGENLTWETVARNYEAVYEGLVRLQYDDIAGPGYRQNPPNGRAEGSSI